MLSTLKRNGWLVRPVCATLMAVLAGGACSTLRPVATPMDFIPAERPAQLWVTTADNATMRLEGPRLLGDTLVGFVAGRYEEIPLPQARTLWVREPATTRTAFLVAGLAVVGASLLYMLRGNGPSAPMGGGEDPSNPSSLLYPRGLR
jgi:hypothetical protein